LRTGLLSAPARVAQAGAPLLFGLLLDWVGLGVLAVSARLGFASAAALLALAPHRTPPRPEPLIGAGPRSSGGLIPTALCFDRSRQPVPKRVLNVRTVKA